MKYIILTMLFMSVMFSGCIFGEEQVVENETVAPPPPPPPKVPTFAITGPLDGEVMIIPEEGGEASLILSSQDLVLKPPGGAKKVGEGHYRITINGESTEFAGRIYNFEIDQGEYNVEVELMHNDRTAYFPSIRRSVSFSVQYAEPEVYVPQEYKVAINDFSYDPAELTVMVSDTVTFENKGAYPRSATCFVNGKQVFDTGVLAPKASKTITANAPFECEYYSTTHRAMTGTLVSESNGMEVAKTSSAKDCGTDLDCFIGAAGSCETSEIVYTADAVFQKTTSTMKITGKDGSKCKFYIKMDNIENAFEVSAEEQAAYDARIGTEGTCNYERSDLQDMLERWKSGQFATSDWQGQECTGTYFS